MKKIPLSTQKIKQARELTSRLAMVDHGGRGTSKGSREALAQHRHPNPRAAGRQCEAIAPTTGRQCKWLCVGKSNRCANHGGHELDPTCEATLRWYRRIGHKIEALRHLKRTLRETIKTITREEHSIVAPYIPTRAAGGRTAKAQQLVLGVMALRAFRDQTDTLAWNRWTRNISNIKVKKPPSDALREAYLAHRAKERG